MGTSKPTYYEAQTGATSVVTAWAFDTKIAEAEVPGLTKKAMATARKQCKERVRYLFLMARN